jgi:hypothetical protein
MYWIFHIKYGVQASDHEKEKRLTHKAVQDLRAPVRLAPEMGGCLGRSAVLLGAVSCGTGAPALISCVLARSFLASRPDFF